MLKLACAVMSLALGATILSPVHAAAQTIDAGPVEIGFGGRAQIQFNTTSVDEEAIGSLQEDAPEIPLSTFVTRRVRLTVAVTIEEWITSRVQPDFALGELSLKDAWLNFAFDDALELRVGQFKKPFSLIELTSTTQYIAIEKALRIRGLESALAAAEDAIDPGERPRPFPFERLPGEEQALLGGLGYSGRDIGLAVHGAYGRATYSIGIFNGNGADSRDQADGKSFAGRLAVVPLTELPVTVGAGVSYRESIVRMPVADSLFAGPVLNSAEIAGFAFEADIEWGDFRHRGMHVLAEATIGENILGSLACSPIGPILHGDLCLVSPTLSNDTAFMGAQGFIAWFQPLDGDRMEGIEPLLRLSFGDPDTDLDADEGWLLTPGFNIYFFGRNRLMLNWDVFVSANEALHPQHSLRAQVNLHF